MPITGADQTTAIAAIIAIFTPAIVDVLKRDTWKENTALLVSILISTLFYVILHALMGTLPFPITLEFIYGLLAVFGVQQLTYKAVFKQRVVEVPVQPAATNIITPNAVVVENQSAVVAPPTTGGQT